MSMGTALAGSLMIAALATGFTDIANKSTVLNAQQKHAVAQKLDRDAELISTTQLQRMLKDAPPAAAEEIVRINDEARPKVIKAALVGILVFAALGLLAATRLPRRRLS